MGNSLTVQDVLFSHNLFLEVILRLLFLSRFRTQSRPYGQGGFSGSTGGQPRITFIQGVPGTRGQTPRFGTKTEVFRADKVANPLDGISKVSVPVVTPVAQ